ncbi:hypothetical protein NQ318_014805 [Aromia moschata]|uniref:Uncharacterized protein n=1 Tax=Aromia moschata TaxID=1265417 RepID=A0AAV8ZDZ4_9CUCU|nr:hypothetical protein NQ318_014805 [Aromia moschata]
MPHCKSHNSYLYFMDSSVQQLDFLNKRSQKLRIIFGCQMEEYIIPNCAKLYIIVLSQMSLLQMSRITLSSVLGGGSSTTNQLGGLCPVYFASLSRWTTFALLLGDSWMRFSLANRWIRSILSRKSSTNSGRDRSSVSSSGRPSMRSVGSFISLPEVSIDGVLSMTSTQMDLFLFHDIADSFIMLATKRC